MARLLLLLAVVVTATVVAEVRGLPHPADLRRSVEDAGAAGVLVYLGGYVLLTLVPAPKGLLTAVGGAFFGLWVGAALAWVAAMTGAVVAFGLGRLLGRRRSTGCSGAGWPGWTRCSPTTGCRRWWRSV